MEDIFVCGICKNSFGDIQEMSKHIVTHVRLKQCSICEEFLPDVACLSLHRCSSHEPRLLTGACVDGSQETLDHGGTLTGACIDGPQNRSDSGGLLAEAFVDGPKERCNLGSLLVGACKDGLESKHDSEGLFADEGPLDEREKLKVACQIPDLSGERDMNLGKNSKMHGITNENQDDFEKNVDQDQMGIIIPVHHVSGEWGNKKTQKDERSEQAVMDAEKNKRKNDGNTLSDIQVVEGNGINIEKKFLHEDMSGRWKDDSGKQESNVVEDNDLGKDDNWRSSDGSSYPESGKEHRESGDEQEVVHIEENHKYCNTNSSDSGETSHVVDRDNLDEEKHDDAKSENVLRCQICDKEFGSSRARKVHQATHPGGFVSDCDLCGKRFKNGSNLARHMRMHRGEKPFKCKVCGKKYADRKTVIVHERVHTGERPHKCEQCGKDFSNPKSYRYHIRQHLGKRVKCGTCGKTFASSANLSVHVRTHGDQQFLCDICDKGFYQLGNLRRHQKTHQQDGDDTEMVMKINTQSGNLTKSTHIRRRAKLHRVTGRHSRHRYESHADKSPVSRLQKKYGRTKIVKSGAKPEESVLQCDLCSQVFSDYSSLKNHIELHVRPISVKTRSSLRLESARSVNSGLKCDLCGKTILTMMELKRHIAGHVGTEGLEDWDEEETDCLDGDIKNRTQGILFKCYLCEKTFEQRQLLKHHFRTHQDEKGQIVSCDVCGKDIISKRSQRPYLCLGCNSGSQGGDANAKVETGSNGKKADGDNSDIVVNISGSFSDESFISDQTNSVRDTQLFEKENSKRKYKKAHKSKVCEICGKAYRSSKRLKLHRQEHDTPPEPTFTCEMCGKSFNRLSGLTRHKKSHASPRLFPCEHCQKNFSCKSKMEIHVRTHTGERPYKCTDCDKTFAAKSGYHQHRQLHLLGKVSCQVCSKILANQSYLKRHMRIHTQEKPYRCKLCGEAFYMYGTFRNHRLAHQGIPPKVYTKKQPATCEVCGKYFLSKYYLISHMRLHTGEKPFTCEICGRGFVQGHGLRRHLQFHEKEKSRPEKKFQCQVCRNFYPDLKNLQRHMIYHNRERNCKCQLCDKAYIRPSHLKRHMIDSHKMNPKTMQKPQTLPQPCESDPPLLQPPTLPQTVAPSAPSPHPSPSVSALPYSATAHVRPQVPPQAPVQARSLVPPVRLGCTLQPAPPDPAQQQQYQQSPNNLQMHTLAPAMFSYY
ncbi:zinc finger protein 585A-like [Haliotis asinina]|uniref:zinc finger protein 585A-like n=1 Tax=Haliotis asinina TaxID=109174 RepID=UPI0035322DF5